MRFENEYLNKIPSQHKIRPKFMKWLSVLLGVLDDSAALLRGMDAAFDLDAAVGQQLDIIGNIVGISRLLDFEPRYAEPLLPDGFYRKVLKAKISLNQWDGTIEGIKKLWTGIFDGYRLDVADNQDMTMTLRVYGVESMFESEFIGRGYLAPKPESVRVNYEFILERVVEEELYIGGKIGSFACHWELRDRPPPGDFEASGGLFCAGRLSIHTAFSLGGPTERS